MSAVELACAWERLAHAVNEADLLDAASAEVERLRTELEAQRRGHVIEIREACAEWAKADKSMMGLIDKQRAELAERTRERDDDRRLVCNWASRSDGVTSQQKADAYGWGYLYPEEPDS